MRRVTTALIAATLCASLTACEPSGGTTSPATPSVAPASPVVPVGAHSASPTPDAEVSETPVASPEPASGTAAEAVAALTVKGRAPKTGYDRDQFGAAWTDVDRNGCDTRNDMLGLRLVNKDLSGTCKVLSGDLNDPYTGTWIHFEIGGASEVDIDHIVAISDAWQKGASQWEFAKRVALANDPLNIEPVEASANRQKGDSDAASWLPSNKPFRCQYVARQAAVKTKYDLWVTQAEQDAMLRVLEACPEEPLPGPGAQPIIASNTGGPPPAPAETSAPAPVDEPVAVGDTDPDWGTCTEAKKHGGGPYVKGVDPEYSFYRDGDKDGTVCE